MAKHKEKRRGMNPILILMLVILMGIFLFSGYKLASTMMEYRKGAQEYDDLRKLADLDADGGSHVLTPEEIAAGKFACPISVDFDALREINDEVIGWLYIRDVDISYPIAQGADNDYYLHRTFRKTYNFAGSVFADYENASDFSDPNTILYGHNMKNDSMFGKLDELVEKEKDVEEPYFWILVPGADYCYQMFGMQRVDPLDEIYTLYHGRDETFVRYAEKCAADSTVDLPEVKFDPDSRIITLSTCTNDSKARFVVQGVLAGVVRHSGNGRSSTDAAGSASETAAEDTTSDSAADEYSEFVTEKQ